MKNLKIWWVDAQKIMTERPWGIKTNIDPASYMTQNSKTVDKIIITPSYKYTLFYYCKSGFEIC